MAAKRKFTTADQALGKVIYGDAFNQIPGAAEAFGTVATSEPGSSITAPQSAQATETISTPTGSTETTQDVVPKDSGPDAYQILNKLLTDNGLGDLSQDIWSAMGGMKITADTSIDQIGFLIKNTDQYKTRFAGNVAREKANKPAYSITQYLQLENAYKNSIQGRGIPSGFYDSYTDYQNFIANDISPSEIADRVDQGFRAVNEGDPEILRQLKTFYPDITQGDLAAFFLDPQTTTPVILNRAKAAQIGAQAVKQAGMQLSTSEAEYLRQQNLSIDEASNAFAQIQAQKELYTPLTAGEEEISRQTQIEAAGGNAAAQQRIAQKKSKRQAEFAAGGGFASSKTGIAGLTTAQ